jgi:MFS family permease
MWVASLVSNIGTWMQQVGAGWLITALSPSAFVVSLVMAANAVPVCLLAVPAGALADIVDRRWYLIATQVWMGLAAAALALLTALHLIDAPALLLLTLMMGIGTALMMPAWAALTPDLVPPDELQAAVSLTSVGMNVSRAIGPALAGAVVSTWGAWATFLLNAVSFAAVIVALLRWSPATTPPALPPERFVSALRLGVRYTRATPALQAVLARTGVFFLCASAGLALLPLVARDLPAGGPGTYGLLLASMGVGAVGGAFLLPRVQGAALRDRVVGWASALLAASLATLAVSRSVVVGVLAMLLFGVGWMAALSTLQVAAQVVAPGWVRARALGVYMFVVFGGMGVGSAIWGAAASRWGTAAGLGAAAAGLIATLPLARRFTLGSREAVDLSPSFHWPPPLPVEEPEPDRGPVLVTVEYEVEPADTPAFVAAMREVERTRRRNGAVSWGLFNDVAAPRRWLEFFVDESWVEHLRHHHRVTHGDQDLEAAVRRFHRGEHAPLVTHRVGPPR